MTVKYFVVHTNSAVPMIGTVKIFLVHTYNAVAQITSVKSSVVHTYSSVELDMTLKIITHTLMVL
jgi:hypothetical protein